MREFRRTMARLDPDSPASSPMVSTANGDSSAFSAEPMGLLTEDVATKVDLPALSATGFSLKPASKQRGRTTGTTVSRGEIPSAAGTEPTPAKGPDYAIESERLDRGARHVAGVDEAGRGPLAGPVVAAAVILDLASLPKGLDDSKKLTAAERERLFDEIVAGAAFCVASASAAEIDRLNIRQATLLAMTRALAGLERQPCHAIVDGRDVPALWASRGTAVISGDARSLSIAAASIVAKVTRDRMMQRLCQAFPAYGFSRHMGYGTAEHRLALDRHGPCPFHRMTFSPIRQGVLDLG